LHTESTHTLDANGRSAKESTGNATTPNRASSGIALEFQNFVADVEDLIQSTTSLSGEDLAQARASLHERVVAAKDSIQKISSPLVDRARNGLKGADSYLHDRPWQAMGIAAGVGLIIGYLLGSAVARRGRDSS